MQLKVDQLRTDWITTIGLSFKAHTSYCIKRAKKERIEGVIPDWSSLPIEIWSLIMEKLPLEDHIYCRSASSFFLSIAQNQQCSSQPRAPWLMHRVNDEDRDTRTLFDMTSNKVYRIQLPELQRTCILGSSEGWLILVDKSTAELQLFSPFTREKIPLPPIITFPGIVGADRDSMGKVTKYHLHCASLDTFYQWEPRFVSKLHFISAFMVSSSCGYIVVVKYVNGGFGFTRVRSNNAAWNAVQIPNKGIQTINITFFNDLFYVMDNEGRVLSFDICGSSNSLQPLLEVAPPAPNIFKAQGSCIKYLVLLPDNSELLLLLVSKLRVGAYKLVHDKQQRTVEWVEVRTLFGHSLFLTSKDNRPPGMMCLSAKDHPAELKRNCIWFTEGGSVDVWDMECRWRRHISSYPLTHISREVGMDKRAPVWVQPVITSL